MTPDKVIDYLLSAEPELLRRVADVADGLLKAKKLESVGAAYRRLAK
jgi:hypothetical protein